VKTLKAKAHAQAAKKPLKAKPKREKASPAAPPSEAPSSTT
jgi:hypothetical protein